MSRFQEAAVVKFAVVVSALEQLEPSCRAHPMTGTGLDSGQAAAGSDLQLRGRGAEQLDPADNVVGQGSGDQLGGVALNTPEGQWASPAPCSRSRMASSATAWTR